MTPATTKRTRPRCDRGEGNLVYYSRVPESVALRAPDLELQRLASVSLVGSGAIVVEEAKPVSLPASRFDDGPGGRRAARAGARRGSPPLPVILAGGLHAYAGSEVDATPHVTARGPSAIRSTST